MSQGFPDSLLTQRLTLRPVRVEDALEINAAVRESFAELHRWMPWAAQMPTLQENVAVCRTMQVQWLLREELMLVFRRRETGELVGCGGFHHPQWEVPAFETGYWCRAKYVGQGLITEAVKALATFAFEQWHAKRVALTCDELNERSWRVAERAGFQLEGTLHRDQLNPQGQARTTRVYARVR